MTDTRKGPPAEGCASVLAGPPSHARPDGDGLTAVFTCTVGGVPAPLSAALQGSSITVTTEEGTRAYDALALALSEDRYALRIAVSPPFRLRAQNRASSPAIVLCLDLLDGEKTSAGSRRAIVGEAIEEARP